MVAGVANVAHLEEQIANHLALDIEVVLVGDRSHLRRIEERHRRIYPLSHRYGAEGSRQRRPRKRWETVTESQGALELGLRHRIAGVCRKAQRRGVPNGITDCGCVRDAGSAANDRVALAGNPVGEGQTWPEIVRV